MLVTEAVAALPIINSFYAEPECIAPGSCPTLSWDVSDAIEVTIVPDVGSVELSESKSVPLKSSTTYILTATNEAGSVTAAVEIMATTSSTHMMTLFSVGAEDGHIVEGGIIHPHPHVGDTDENRARQAFLSFDISSIPIGAIIKSASLDLSDGDEIGKPFIGLGVMRVYNHQHDILDSNEFCRRFSWWGSVQVVTRNQAGLSVLPN